MEPSPATPPLRYPSMRAVLRYLPMGKRKELSKHVPAIRQVLSRIPFYFEYVSIKIIRKSTSPFYCQIKADRLKFLFIYNRESHPIFHAHDLVITNEEFEIGDERYSRRIELPLDLSIETSVQCFMNYYFNRRGTCIKELNLTVENPDSQLQVTSLLSPKLVKIQNLRLIITNGALDGTMINQLNEFDALMLSIQTGNAGNKQLLLGLKCRLIQIDETTCTSANFIAHCKNIIARKSLLDSYYKADIVTMIPDDVDYLEYIADQFEGVERSIVMFSMSIRFPCLTIPMTDTTVLNISREDNSATAAVMLRDCTIPRTEFDRFGLHAADKKHLCYVFLLSTVFAAIVAFFLPSRRAFSETTTN